MLTLHFANRYETLSALLTSALQPAGQDLFTPDEVIVPSAALRRQLTLQLAREQGVCTNLRFSYLAQWLWQQANRVVAATATGAPPAPAADADAPWQAKLLAWRVYGVLADAGWVAGHPRLARYLAQADAVTRLDLAQRVAGLLDQYITYRPDWLATWAAGRLALPPGSTGAVDEAWQAALWRRLHADLQVSGGSQAATPGVDPTAAHTLAAALARIDAGDTTVHALRRAGLPAAAHVFCLPTIAPVYLALLQQLGRWMDLRIYALNPCEAYWFEVVDRRRLARLAAAGRDAHHEVGHRLLAAWGQQAQAQLAGLVDACGDAVIDDDHYTPHPAPTLLGALHNSILRLEDLAPGSVPLLPGDRSIEVHVGHSLTRELEVLHDTLLAMMAHPDPAQRPAPGEILVVTPDLDAAAPLIHGVFGTAPRERALPYTLTGQSVSQANAPARALLALLALAGSRCTASAVFGLLQQPVVARRFGLDDDDLDQVHRWLLQSGVHWGLDAEHRAGLGLPAVARHSLADGLDRLMLGYALPGQATGPFDHKLPAGAAEGTDALALGALWRFVEALRRLQAEVALPLPPTRWPLLLASLVERFLQPDASEQDDAAELRAALGTLAEQWQRSGLDQPLPLDVLRQALTQALDDPARGGVPTGRITFSSMSSLRGLPYRVVCAIGLNDGAFPSATRPAEFDLLAHQPRPGDRQRRTDERNLFLDLLLAARDRVHLSCTGRSVRDNAPLPPSVLVAELLDYLLPAIDATPAEARARLVVEHPLQAFDASLFDPATDPRQRSHHREYALALAGARPAPAVLTPTQQTDDEAFAAESDQDADEGADEGADDNSAANGALPPFFARPLAAQGPEARHLDLEQLQRFFRHPSRTLLQQRLGIRLRQPDEALDDDEPFLPGWRSRAELAQRLLPALAAGADDAMLMALAEAGTELPSGTLGRLALQAELPLLRGHAGALAALTAAPLLPTHAASLTFEVSGQAWRLDIALADLRPEGLVRHRYAEARVADYLGAWIAHLALCTCAPAGVAGRTRWLGRDATFGFKPCDDAPEQLQNLLALMAQGLCEPLYFFPKTAWAWASNGQSLGKASAAWHATARNPFAEQADAAHRLALRGLPDPLGDGLPRFEAAAEAVLGPLLQHLDDGPAP
jgi:exodeoxyribonuclease V gamma subunit